MYEHNFPGARVTRLSIEHLSGEDVDGAADVWLLRWEQRKQAKAIVIVATPIGIHLGVGERNHFWIVWWQSNVSHFH